MCMLMLNPYCLLYVLADCNSLVLVINMSLCMLRLISTCLECIPMYARLLLWSQFYSLDRSPSLWTGVLASGGVLGTLDIGRCLGPT